MNGRRVLLGVFTIVALAASVFATGGFASVDADRGVDVSIADDDDAYLGISTETATVAANRSDDERLASFTNRFEEDVTVDVTVVEGSDDHPTVENVSDPGTVAVGDTSHLTADVICENGTASEDLTLEIDASGSDVAVEATRQVTVECTD